MKGWDIFAHSMRQVFGNLGAALRISAVPYLVIVGMILALGLDFHVDVSELRPRVEEGTLTWGSVLALFAATYVMGLLIAVNWHRYILLDEQPGLFPEIHGMRMLGYLGKAFWIMLTMAVPAAAITFVGSMGAIFLMTKAIYVDATKMLPVIEYSGNLIVQFLIYIPTLRLLTILPGSALRPGVSIWEGWTATKGEIKSFAVLAIILILWAVAYDQVLSLFDTQGLPVIIYQAAHGWLSLIVWISILTTLYGHYIEKRPLL